MPTTSQQRTPVEPPAEAPETLSLWDAAHHFQVCDATIRRYIELGLLEGCRAAAPRRAPLRVTVRSIRAMEDRMQAEMEERMRRAREREAERRRQDL